ncbi:hypothetical protein Adt_27128 [Abeliophyllum distichum]|uniref:Uncharacterized protein n=1 Tax=Abeliophyllum distichum TaxID=126358 RepID=A0ABD1RSV4_9LAMI
MAECYFIVRESLPNTHTELDISGFILEGLGLNGLRLYLHSQIERLRLTSLEFIHMTSDTWKYHVGLPCLPGVPRGLAEYRGVTIVSQVGVDIYVGDGPCFSWYTKFYGRYLSEVLLHWRSKLQGGRITVGKVLKRSVTPWEKQVARWSSFSGRGTCAKHCSMEGAGCKVADSQWERHLCEVLLHGRSKLQGG